MVRAAHRPPEAPEPREEYVRAYRTGSLRSFASDLGMVRLWAGGLAKGERQANRLLNHWVAPDGAGEAVGCVAATFNL